MKNYGPLEKIFCDALTYLLWSFHKLYLICRVSIKEKEIKTVIHDFYFVAGIAKVHSCETFDSEKAYEKKVSPEILSVM